VPGLDGCLERHLLAEPDAVCVDGTPGAYYLRRAPEDSPDTDRWVIHLEGGGGICVDLESCLAMWEGDPSSGYGAEKMSSRWTPPAIEGEGIERPSGLGLRNRFGPWNHAFLYMCSTDDWIGDADQTFGPDDAHQILLHFRGARILLATLAELAAEHDLGVASEVLLTGSSAGGNGARFAADRVRELVRTPERDVAVRVVVDSAVKPIAPFSDPDAYTWDHYDAYASTGGTRGFDASCAEGHPDEPEWCGSPDHVLYNHVSTPMFVRQGLREKLPDGVDEQDWREATREHLLALADLPQTAEDGDEIQIAPGFFGPDSDRHTALHSDLRFFGGAPDERVNGASFHDALWLWLEGEPVGWVAP
jgi:hypothetical protein